MTGDRGWTRTLAELERLPVRPRKVTGPDNWFNVVSLVADYLTTVPPAVHRWTLRFRGYPAPFRRAEFEARDGVKLVGWLGETRPENDAVLLIPGLYTSKDNPRIRARAIRLLRDWGLNVLALDLRGVGESERTYSTPGWKEAEDIIDAVRFLRTRARVGRIHLYAESLAASAAILAAGMEAREGRKLLDGRIIAMSAYAHAKKIVDLYGRADPKGTELGADFVAVQRCFNALLRLQGYKGGRFDAYIRDGAKHYGVTLHDLYQRSSPEHYIADVNVPLLVVHSTDDGLVPVSEAEELARRAEGNPAVKVWILPWGYHCLYEMADAEWYWGVLGRMFAGVDGTVPKRNRGAATRTSARAGF